MLSAATTPLHALSEQSDGLHDLFTRKVHVMARPGAGKEGKPIQLLSNHFVVRFGGQDKVFYQYTISIKTEDGVAVDGNGFRRRVIDRLYRANSSELSEKQFAYDGDKSLYTSGPLPKNNFEFAVTLEELSFSIGEGDRKRSRHSHRAKTFKVEIKYATKILLRSILQTLQGNESHQTQDALRVLDIILRQEQAKRGCLVVRQSSFDGNQANCIDLHGGVSGCRGFHSSFCTTLEGLSLNMDVSTTIVVTPGSVLDFLRANQNIHDLHQIDWVKAKLMLKNIRVNARHIGKEFQIIGLSDMPCNQQMFSLKLRSGGGNGQTIDLTVYDYFSEHRKIELSWSAYVPCLDVGKPDNPCYLPLELCDIVPLQRYTKALSYEQRSLLLEKSRQKPMERMRVITDAVINNRYDEDPMLTNCGIFIDKQLTQLDGRVLTAPTLKVGNLEDCIPQNGRWNFTNKRVWDPVRIEKWAIVNFSARCDMSYISRELIKCGRDKGIHIDGPYTLIEEDQQYIKAAPVTRVEKVFEQVLHRLPGYPEFILCILAEKKSSDIYGPWKKKNLLEMGIVTQCIAPKKINDQYLTNVLLKINAKLGGVNSILSAELANSIPLINNNPTMIMGMDVSHSCPGSSDMPSIAAVVGSRYWPQISRYRASVRAQSPKVELIDALYKPLENGADDGIIRELLLDFYQTSGSRKPKQLVIFRDGVSESQFNQVLNVELKQIIKVFDRLGEPCPPKFTVIVAQKKHHTRFFQANQPENIPAGTVVDTAVVHPSNYDFYICPHAGPFGTSRPTHYHVLLDEIGFSVDELQALVHSLSYVSQRSSSVVATAAPIYYAHLAAAQMTHFVKLGDPADATASGSSGIPELPKLHPNVRSSMFFC